MDLSTLGRRRRPSVAPAEAAGGRGPQRLGRLGEWQAPAGTLGQVLLSRGLVGPEDLRFALRWQRSLTGEWPVNRLGSLLVKAGCISAQQVAEVIAEQRGVAVLGEVPAEVPPWLRGIFPADLLRQVGAVPLYIAGRTVVVGMLDPHRAEQTAVLQRHTGYAVQPVLILQLHASKLLRSMNAR